MPSLMDRFRGLMETKAAVPPPVAQNDSSFEETIRSFRGMFGNGRTITMTEAWSLYKSVGTLATAIDLIADAVAKIQPVVDEQGEIIKDHPLLMPLEFPGFGRDRRRLIKAMVVQYLVAGTGYMHSIGNTANLPLAFDTFKTRDVNAIEGSDGFPQSVLITEARRSFRFQREEGIDMRFFDGPVSELLTIYDMEGDLKGTGLSRLQAVANDVDVKLNALIHNKSMIDKGARLSGILNSKNNLRDDDKKYLRQAFEDQASGAENAGRVLVTGGGDWQFQQLGMSPKDMDWANMSKIVDEAIISRYGVPRALFSTDAQTHNNYATAWRAFYEGIVSDTFDVIYSALGRHLTMRTGKWVKITYDPLSIPVLAETQREQAIKLYSGFVITPNEARSMIGMEPVDGGDEMYRSGGGIPLSEDFGTYEEDPVEDDDGTQAEEDVTDDTVDAENVKRLFG